MNIFRKLNQKDNLIIFALILCCTISSCKKDEPIFDEPNNIYNKRKLEESNISKTKNASIIYIEPVDVQGCQLPPYVREFVTRANQTIGNHRECEYNAVNKFRDAYSNYRFGNYTSCHYAISQMASAIDEYYRCQRDYLLPEPITHPEPPLSGGGTTSTPTVVILTPVNSIDLKKRLDCFKTKIATDANTTYKVTLHVDIPDNMDASKDISNSNAGHVYLTLTKSNSLQSYNLSMGFYPKSHRKIIRIIC